MQIVDFSKSFIEWQTKTNSKGRFLIDASLKTPSNYYCLGAKVIACNVYNEANFFHQPAYSFQAVVTDNDYSIYRIFAENIKTQHSFNKPLADFKSFTKNIFELKNYTLIEDYTILLQNFNQHKNLQVLLTYNTTELQFVVKHININEQTQQFQVETGEVLIENNEIILKAYITFSAFNYAELLIETKHNEKYFFNQQLIINPTIKIIAS